MKAIALAAVELPKVSDCWLAATCKTNFRVRYLDHEEKWQHGTPYLAAWADLDHSCIISCHLDVSGDCNSILEAFDLACRKYPYPKAVYLEDSPDVQPLIDYFDRQRVDIQWADPYSWQFRATEHLLRFICNWFSLYYSKFRCDAPLLAIPIDELPTIADVTDRFCDWIQKQLKLTPVV